MFATGGMMAVPSASRSARMAERRFLIIVSNRQNITKQANDTVPRRAAENAIYSPVIITHTLFLLVSYHPESPL